MEPQNLLIIMADEHSSKMLGCYDHPRVHTPNLDVLAASGARFTNAYTNNPICIPARATIATGRHTHQTGYWDNVLAYDGRVPSWSHRLSQADCTSTSIGKLHYASAEAPTGFDAQIVPMHVYGGGDLHGLIRNPPPARPQSRKLAETIGAGESEFTEYDRDIAARACAWLRDTANRNPARPWTLFVSFICPHFPLTAPEPYFSMYDPVDMHLPKPAPARSGAMAKWWGAFEDCYSYDRYFENDAHRQRALAGYLALCTFIDHLTGQVLGALREADLATSTRVLYTSDHGDNLGARGLWAKSTMYEESAAIPMIVAGAEVPRGRVVGTPVSLIDLYPTVLHSSGITDGEGDAEHPGRSLLHIASEPDDQSRTVFAEYHATAAVTAEFMIRRGRYKYIHYVGHGAELFDLETDPEEIDDLSGRAEHAATLAEFEAELRAMLDPEAVDARAKADQRNEVERLGGRDAVLGMPVPYATPAPTGESHGRS